MSNISNSVPTSTAVKTRGYLLPLILTVVVAFTLAIVLLASNSLFNVAAAFGYGEGPGATDVSNIVDNTGSFTSNAVVTSVDNTVALNIPQGTVGKDASGAPLPEIQVVEMDNPPPPPTDNNVIGVSYDLGPDGATFDPPITVTFSYDPADIPEGVDPSTLTIAFYDEATGQWTQLTNIVVDPVNHTISGDTSHFTTFAVLVPEPQAAPGPTITTITITRPDAPVTVTEPVFNWTIIWIIAAVVVFLAIFLPIYLRTRRD